MDLRLGHAAGAGASARSRLSPNPAPAGRIATMFEPRHLRLLLLGLAASLAGLVVWRAIAAPPAAPSETVIGKRFERAVPPAPAPELIAAERRTIADSLSNAREFGLYVHRLSDAYPADWNRLLDSFALRALASRAPESPEAYVSESIRALRRDRGVVASRAGPDAVARVFDAQARLLGGLAGSDSRLCVDFMLGQTSPAFLAFAARHRDLLAEMAMASLEAMIAGETSSATPDQPGDADFDQLEQALVKRGLGKPEIGALLDGRWPNPPIPDSRMCDAGLIYFDALKTLPDDARQRIYALAVRTMGG